MALLPDHNKLLGCLGLGLALGLCVSRLRRRTADHIIPSPLQSLIPHLTASEITQLAYPPDALPGARDVESPYGSLRVYEWGAVSGSKVLLVHGISTPSIALGAKPHHHHRAG